MTLGLLSVLVGCAVVGAGIIFAATKPLLRMDCTLAEVSIVSFIGTIVLYAICFLSLESSMPLLHMIAFRFLIVPAGGCLVEADWPFTVWALTQATLSFLMAYQLHRIVRRRKGDPDRTEPTV